MNNFTFHNPTRLLFGKGMIEKLSTAHPDGASHHDHFWRR